MSDSQAIPPFVDRMLKNAEALVFPAIGSQLLALFGHPVEQKRLAEIILQDPGLSAIILRNINAAGIPVAKEIDSVERAINILGAKQVFSIAFAHVVTTQLRSVARSVTTTVFLEFWRRSLLTALLAERLRSARKADVPNAYSLGLLYHLGMVILIEAYDTRYLSMARMAGVGLERQIERENQEFGTNFEIVGHRVMRDWGFPAAILDPLAPGLERGRPDRDLACDAASLANRCMLFDAERLSLEGLDDQLLDVLLDPATEPRKWADPTFRDWFVDLLSRIRQDLAPTQ